MNPVLPTAPAVYVCTLPGDTHAQPVNDEAELQAQVFSKPNVFTHCPLAGKANSASHKLPGELEKRNGWRQTYEARVPVWLPQLCEGWAAKPCNRLTESLLREGEKLPRTFRNYRAGVGKGGCGK